MKRYILFTALVAFSFMGCQKVLDTRPGDTYSEVDIYSNIALTERLVFYSYNITENWGLNEADWWTRRAGIENATDEAWFHFVPQNFKITRGLISPNDMGFFRNLWDHYYKFIGTTNEFLNKIDGSPVAATNPNEVATLKGEMKYLRAYGYTRLVSFFGGVPIIDKPFTLKDNFTRPRNSYQESVDFIVKELDEAIALLPSGTRSGVEFGRVSKGAAMALKSRILLYAASAQHDPSNGNAPRGPLYDYNKNNKWKDAADAAKALIDMNAYSLVPVANAKEYQEMFLKPNSELIFARPFHPDFPNTPDDFNTLPDKAQSPVGSGGWGLSNPTHNFVQDFKMANGKRITEAGSNYDANDMYANREMRFYANINYQGGTFKGRELQYWSPGGADSKDAAGPNHYAATGYNLRKFLDESIVIDKQQSAKRPYPLARLSEIYLNYAEAQFHLGNEAEARQYASMVSQRVGLPAITSSGAELLKDIKYERQMELYFEGHRFFDLRRWMDESKLAEDVLGVQWEKRNASGALDPNGTLVMIGPKLIEDRTFLKANYYLPISTSEIEKSGMQQNLGY